MRTLTRCPGCHTVFVVHRDQLEVRDGRVRCGACGTVFDARVSLEVLEGAEGDRTAIVPAPAIPGARPVAVSAPPAASDAKPRQERTTKAKAPDRVDELFEEAQPILLDMGPLPGEATGGPPATPATTSIAAEDEATLVLPGAKREAFPVETGAQDKEPLFADEPGEGTTTAAAEAQPDPTLGSASDAATPAGDLSDGGEGRASVSPITLGPDGLIAPEAATADDAAADGRRPGSAVVFRAADAADGVPDFAAQRREQARVARTWALACIPVALLLAIQGAFHWRAELGAVAPGARGLLTVLCAPFGCEVGLPQHAALLALEGTNLEAEPTGTLTLYATLRNRARYEQALPAIELTLTDPRDQPVARRLLMPGDYAPDRRGGVPAGGEVQVRVTIDASATKAAGFRAEAVYP